MNKKELITKLKELAEDLDCEYAHVEADNLLIEYINDKEIKEAFDKVCKWFV